jgi:hypothetical protein
MPSNPAEALLARGFLILYMARSNHDLAESSGDADDPEPKPRDLARRWKRIKPAAAIRPKTARTMRKITQPDGLLER